MKPMSFERCSYVPYFSISFLLHFLVNFIVVFFLLRMQCYREIWGGDLLGPQAQFSVANMFLSPCYVSNSADAERTHQEVLLGACEDPRDTHEHPESLVHPGR